MAGKPIEDPAPKTNPSWARLDVGIGFLLGLGPFGRENRIRIEIRRNDSKRGCIAARGNCFDSGCF